MSAPTLQRVIDRPVTCSYCHKVVRESKLAEHVGYLCKKARLVRDSVGKPAKPANKARLAPTAVKRKPVAQASTVQRSPLDAERKVVATPRRPSSLTLSIPKVESEPLYTRDQVKLITEAYQHIFGTISPELRAYWDLDRKRAWGCLTSDFYRATYEQHQEASRRAIEIEKTILEPVQRGEALREVTRQTGVGLSLGVCPWTDHGLFQSYAKNKDKRRLTIILGHDWYPIVPPRALKPHPVDVPLRPGMGLRGLKKYISVGAVPAAIIDNDELLLFLNFKPDFRPPNTPVKGPFEPYDRCAEGFVALLNAVSREFKVQVISWGADVWSMLAQRVMRRSNPPGVCIRVRDSANFGRPLELQVGRTTVPYLPLAHPCDPRNFDAHHAAHAHEGFLRMGLGGSGRVAAAL